ncbi:MAG: hypothetical protein ACYCUM_05950 [Solirubrobacteraceae bacterium]
MPELAAGRSGRAAFETVADDRFRLPVAPAIFRYAWFAALPGGFGTLRGGHGPLTHGRIGRQRILGTLDVSVLDQLSHVAEKDNWRKIFEAR